MQCAPTAASMRQIDGHFPRTVVSMPPFGRYAAVDREGIRFGYEDMTQTEVDCFNRTETLA